MSRMTWMGWVVVLAGCAAAKPAVVAAPAPAVVVQVPERRYVDADLGFQVTRPEGSWRLDATDERTPEGVAVPVILRNTETGAQVVIQIAPAVASPTQFAERLTSGLRAQPGFSASDPEPIPLSDSAVGFHFEMGDRVQGKVAVLEGGSGRVFLMLATWPKAAPGAVDGVDEIFDSVKPVPVTGSGG